MTRNAALLAALLLAPAASAQAPFRETYGQLVGERFGQRVLQHVDIDGDGLAEYAVAHARGVRILRGSDGSIVRDLASAERPIGDLDGDGQPDYWAAVRDDFQNITRIDVLSSASGTSIVSIPWEWDLYSAVGEKWNYPLAFDDVDGDGFDDFLVQVTRLASSINTSELRVVSGRTQSVLRVHPNRASVVALDDIDGDGVRDYYMPPQGLVGPSALVASGATGAALATPAAPPLLSWGDILSVGDVDNDGAEDIAFAQGFAFNGTATTTIVSTMTGAVISTFAGALANGDSGQGAHGDFDGDGAEDVALLDLIEHELVLRTCATGAVVRTDHVFSTSALGLPDMNGDGRDEVLVGVLEARAYAGKALVLAGPYSEVVGTAFGFGDGSSGPCPCANGAVGRGCANSQGAGAKLEALGKASMAERDLRLHIEGHWVDLGLLGRSFLIASATPATTPPVFYGGLLALAPPFQRVARTPFRSFDAPSLAAWSTWTPGQTQHFQVWYREGAPTAACGATGNLSNALSITFTP